MGILYVLTFSNSKKYIGITRGTLSNRFQGHRDSYRRGTKSKLYAAWAKYGAPIPSTLAVVENDDLLQAEVRAISMFGTQAGGYNTTPGGDDSPMLVPEVVEKVRQKARTPERIARNIEIHLGSKRTAECRQKMSEMRIGMNKGVPKSPEHCAKISAALRVAVRTYVATDEHRAKISKANSGRKFTEEHKRKIAAAHVGKKLSEETKAKLRKPKTEEHKANMQKARAAK